jgi:hypothetical protein
MISPRSKILIACSCLGPISLAIIWSVEFWILREVQSGRLSTEEAAKSGWAILGPWVHVLFPLALGGFLCTVPTILSLYFDNRKKKVPSVPLSSS